MKTTQDKYDEAVEYFREYPENIYIAWNRAADAKLRESLPLQEQAHALALFGNLPGSNGCLTQVRDGIKCAANPGITKEITLDTRIPLDGNGITPENLNVFAEWQRKLHQTT